MSVSLYRKYRSKSLDEIVGQKGIVKALKTAIKTNAISHAYLFTGPRGVGKTSIARILAYAIINVPYDPDNLPVDIIEIDAASNRGIDEIRDLREKVRVAPVSAKYKVYIIDEVHMLTTPAFNALLKTLEEPPAHVVFILATTESHKLPETIISRTQRYNFSLATATEVKDHLAYIAKEESIKISDEALELIAIHSGGSMRDALSLLDHVRHTGNNITADDVRTNIGLPSAEVIRNILNAIANNDASDLLNQINVAEQDNVAAVTLAGNIIQSLKGNIHDKNFNIAFDQLRLLLKGLSRVESSIKPELQLTIALLEAIKPTQTAVVADGKTAESQPAAVLQAIPVKTIVQPATKAAEPVKKKLANDIKPDIAKGQPSPEAPAATIDFSETVWQAVLEDIRATHNTIYSVLRMAELDLKDIADKKICINFKFPFHQKRMSDSKNMAIIQKKLADNGYHLEVECSTLLKNTADNFGDETPEQKPNSPLDTELSKIRGVFGGAEVME